MFKDKILYDNYIKQLLINQNNTNIDYMQNIYTKKDYDTLLRPVLKVIKENPHASNSTLRYKLFIQSGIKELINNFVNQTCITPGILLDFGTRKNRDTILCGLRQECIYENNQRIEKPLPIEQDTIFDLASTSKPFTTIAILKLYESNLLDVFKPIKEYVKEFKNLGDTTIYDLLKFRVNIVTDKRIDSAKTKEEALDILYTVHPSGKEYLANAYTDMGAMVLRLVVEKVSKMSFIDYVNEEIFKKAKMKDTFLKVPIDKLARVANENYSATVDKNGIIHTRLNTYPGVVHDTKALAMGSLENIAPGHAGFFSTKDDMLKFAQSLIDEKIISKNGIYTISDSCTGIKEDDKYTRFYGSLVYLKQPDPRFLSVYPPLSGKAFMSPGFAGCELVVDPLNDITLFIASPRLHDRIYQIDENQVKNIQVDEHNKKTYQGKIVCSEYTKNKEVLVTLALDLALQYQLLETLRPTVKELHLVRELNN